MTDPTTPDTPRPDDDELASALLDDEPVDGAPVASTPELRRRAEQLKAAADAVAEPVPALDDATIDRLVSTALAAAEEGADGEPAVPLAPRPAGRARARRRVWLPPPAVAAAVVLVVALVGIALIVTDGRSGSGSGGRQSAADRAAAAKVAGGEASAAATAPDTLRAVPGLGSFDDQAALRTALGTVAPTSLEHADAASAVAVAGGAASSPSTVPAPASTGGPAPTSAPAAPRIGQKVIVRCDDVIRATDPSLGARLAVATATVAGRAVLVYSHREGAGAATGAASSTTSGTEHSRLTVADRQTCAILFAVRR